MQKTIGILICLLGGMALAGGASHWTHSTEADFKAGSFHNVVASNLGDLKLSRAVKTLLEQDPRLSAVYAMVEGPDKTIYAGTGPQGLLLQIKDDKVTTLAKLEDGTNIFSLLMDNKGRLLIGTGGEKGRIFRIEKAGDKPHEIFAAEGVQYVWAMQQTPDGIIYAATGPTGELHQINPDDSHQLLYKSDQHNLVCLLSDGGDLLYAGTDPGGLVYRINRKQRSAFVLYNASESEISCLALDGAGNLYAATAEAKEPTTSAADDAGAREKVGRPEGGTGGVPIPGDPPAAPKPPEMPHPNPGEPMPIPKNPVFSDAAPDKPAPPTPPKPGHDQPAANANAQPNTPGKPVGAAEVETKETKPEGNAIYRIDRNGFVAEVFRQPVMVTSLLIRDGVLLVGTGNEGLVYQVNPAAEETLVLAKVDPKQVLCMMNASDGRIILGLANVGGIAAMSSGFAGEGTFTSPVLDASQVSRFGKMHLEGTLPAGTALKVSTRSGNVREPDENLWSKWTPDTPAFSYMQITSPQARFLQYRLTLTSQDARQSPVVNNVDVAYQIPNQPPAVKSIKIAPSDKSAEQQPAEGKKDAKTATAGRMQTIAWEAADPDNDALQYSLYFRQGRTGPWVLLKDKLKEAEYEWDTRGVADGQYQVKVVASDEAANAPGTGRTGSRVSDPVVVDNTPPVIGDMKRQIHGLAVDVGLKVVDQTSIVAGLDYAVDSHDDWQAVLPSDNIADSPEETYGFTVPNLKPGLHQITIRATDSHGNQAFENILVTIEEGQNNKKD